MALPELTMEEIVEDLDPLLRNQADELLDPQNLHGRFVLVQKHTTWADVNVESFSDFGNAVAYSIDDGTEDSDSWTLHALYDRVQRQKYGPENVKLKFSIVGVPEAIEVPA